MPTPRRPLAELEQADNFVHRHIGPSDDAIAVMLETIGVPALEILIERAVPKAILADSVPDLPGATEPEALAELRAFGRRNTVVKSLIGMGYHGCYTPPVVLRNVLENPGWYTAYTPYQAEISQGRLEALLNYQQMIVDLTGMEIANASLLDEGTAAAEAMTLMLRTGKSKSRTLFVDSGCHPQTIAVVQARAEPLGITLVIGDPEKDLDPGDVYAALFQYPATDGRVRDLRPMTESVHAAGGMVAVATDLLSLMLLAAPGEWGADIAIGNSQRFGVSLGFGGPHAAFMATKDSAKRSIPGRIVGVSQDARGKPGLRLALQTREQHIRREKATSNICTAQVLLAVMAAFYAIYHGPEGLRTIAQRVHRLTSILAAGLRQLGVEVHNRTFFDTLTVTPAAGSAVHARALAADFNLRKYADGRVGVSLDETTTRADVEALLGVLADKPAHGLKAEALDAGAPSGIPDGLWRTSAVLEHPVFNVYHSETEMLRYLKRLEDRDIALNRSMIPLGSCTMKLNATTEMMPVTWPEFAAIHPFAPVEQAEGYIALIKDLETKLAKLTGFAAVSLQPNAGSQGEYAGLLAIRAYHRARGQGQCNICLIPASAHGTNPASASMANMQVVVVACDQSGNVDLDDLRRKSESHKDNLAALMVTYPSTHGVFEAAIRDICQTVHDNGGQVYMDGANLNALVGICLPGQFGPDVAHMNLHKTFCIPHGGGGPGVGPIGVASHLAAYLPNHPLVADAGPATGIGPISAAPWGSAGILPIPWAYIRMMGTKGLRRATQVAILNANYVARRLAEHYPVLYTGKNGLVAHECILDLRKFEKVSVEDVAKRLMDYGFHAPTMSFPVSGTLMVEPTESESKAELDRFCDAMIAIRKEIARVESGEWPAADNPLHNAPHPADVVSADSWTRPYSREQAAYPAESLRDGKYWPPVSRIDNVYGDRHLVCTCPPIDAYQQAAE